MCGLRWLPPTLPARSIFRLRSSGGGYSGQAGAVVQGLGRAIAMYDVALRPGRRKAGS